MTNFDIVVAAGGSFKAIDKQFPLSVSNGGIGILLTGLVQNPKISAIEITTAGGTVVTVSPATATLSANQSKQFSATVTGSTNTAVVWSMTPLVGTLSSSGLYTAPASITSTQAVTVKATSAADSTKSASAIVTLQPPTTGGGFAIRVNAGGSAYTDPQGKVWSADAGYNAGSSYSATTAVTGTTTPTLYQTERWTNGTLTYQFSVPNGNYNVNLKFAEIYFSVAGNRMFNVVINGQALLTNFDIVAAAGGAFKAVDRQFPISVSTGSIITQLTPLIENPKISAIEITALQ